MPHETNRTNRIAVNRVRYFNSTTPQLLIFPPLVDSAAGTLGGRPLHEIFPPQTCRASRRVEADKRGKRGGGYPIVCSEKLQKVGHEVNFCCNRPGPERLMEPRRGENQNQETSLTKSCEAVSETVMAKAVGPALSQTFLRPGPTRPKIDKAKVRGFPSGPGAVFKEQTPHFREAEYMAATDIPHSIFPSKALLQEAVHIQAQRARRFESGPPSSQSVD